MGRASLAVLPQSPANDREAALGFHLGMCLTPPKGTCAKLGVGLEFNGLRPQMRFNVNHTYIHFIRHPVSMIVSGYLYHRRCPEAWTKQARLLHTHPNVTDYWSGYGNSATAGLFFGVPEQRLALAELLTNGGGNATERSMSYCQLLQARNESVGVRAETIRSIRASDGVRRMLADRVRLELATTHHIGSGAASSALPWHFSSRVRRPILHKRFGRLMEVCLGDVMPADSPRAHATWGQVAALLDVNASKFKPKFMGLRYESHKSQGSGCVKQRLARHASVALAEFASLWLGRLHGYPDEDAATLNTSLRARIEGGPCYEEAATCP